MQNSCLIPQLDRSKVFKVSAFSGNPVQLNCWTKSGEGPVKVYY